MLSTVWQDSTPGLGAILDAEGGCVFRVWAPEAQHAELVLLGANTPEDDTVLGMRREGGNFGVRAPGVRAVSLSQQSMIGISSFSLSASLWVTFEAEN